MNEIIFTACCTVAAIEILSYIAGGERSFRTVCSLAVTLVMLSSFISVAEEIKPAANFEFTQEDSPEELYLSKTQVILEKQIVETLSSAGIYDVRPEVILSINDDSEVDVVLLKVGVTYSADMERAKIIVDSLFSDMVETEVYLIDG